MPFQYKQVLVIGATSGIGKALAREARPIRRAARERQLFSVQFDVTALDKIPGFVSDITKAHPDINYVLLNSGTQRGFDFSNPDTIDLSVLEDEFKTNYLSFIHLTTAFLPYLQKKEKSALIYTSSGLALVPLVRCPNYCASKAALHHFLLALRQQLKRSSVQVIEIFPPAVQTELHDEKHQPDIKNGRQIGMPLDSFIDETYTLLARGDDEITVGNAKNWYDAFEPARQRVFEQML